VLAVLQNRADAPQDLKDRALLLASHLLELGGAAPAGAGAQLARSTLEAGAAWNKFQRICEAQGGMRVPPVALHRHTVVAGRAGLVASIDNRRLAKLAKLAGAPDDKAAGLELHVRLSSRVGKGDPLYTVHADAPGELHYALHFARANRDIIRLENL
jgi:thymidine phosphorylase